MGKRLTTLLLTAGLIGGVLSVAPANAAPDIPATPNIVDPKGDANYLNDQGSSTTPAGYQGDHVTPADAGSVSDVMAVWFGTTPDRLITYIQTEVKGPATASAYLFRIKVDPGSGTNCLWIQGVSSGPSAAGAGASVRDTCSGDTTTQSDVVPVWEDGPDGSGIFTIDLPREASAAFADGATLAKPILDVRNFTGAYPSPSLTAPQIDGSAPGTDYLVGSGGTVATPEKPTKPAKPVKTKKPKKPKKPKPPKSGSCPAFVPGDAGKDKPLVTVTDAATEAAPVEQKVTLAQSVADLQAGDPSIEYLNVQVDSAAPAAGLYVLFDFPERRDYDLGAMYPDGSYGGQSHSWNTFVELTDKEANGFAISRTGNAGASTSHSEQIVGLKTSDCGGWTIEVANYLGEGGDMAVKVWLGEAKTDPSPEGEVT
jgi:hypothetical protein